MESENTFRYGLDAEGHIRWISDNWGAFARENGWSDAPQPEDVVGNPVLDFICDSETRHLYEQLFKIVRKERRSVRVPYRCDSPTERRYMQLELEPGPDGGIDVTSTIVRTESRETVRLLDPEAPHSDEFLRICSMCKKIDIDGGWYEIEEAIQRLRLFEAAAVPQLTHGLCDACANDFMAFLDNRKRAG